MNYVSSRGSPESVSGKTLRAQVSQMNLFQHMTCQMICRSAHCVSIMSQRMPDKLLQWFISQTTCRGVCVRVCMCRFICQDCIQVRDLLTAADIPECYTGAHSRPSSLLFDVQRGQGLEKWRYVASGVSLRQPSSSVFVSFGKPNH